MKMSEFQIGFLFGAVLGLSPFIAGILLALAVHHQERSIAERAREAGL